jgi:hypothetical protein
MRQDLTLMKVLIPTILLLGCTRADEHAESKAWGPMVRVAGQSEPIPQKWLTDEEAKFAHSIKLPDVIPKTVPFDFEKAKWTGWLPGRQSAEAQYWQHLCATEAGEWVLKTANDVKGLYFARPPARPTSDQLSDRYGLEAPHFEREYEVSAESAESRGGKFVHAPWKQYEFVEEPRRPVKWQSHIGEPYIKLFGLKSEMYVLDPRAPSNLVSRQVSPMQVTGIEKPTSRYIYTWRGLKRAHDRANQIAGTEMIILDRHTNEVMAVRRTFSFGSAGKKGQSWKKVFWLTSASCLQANTGLASGEIQKFALRVLKPIVAQ